MRAGTQPVIPSEARGDGCVAPPHLSSPRSLACRVLKTPAEWSPRRGFANTLPGIALPCDRPMAPKLLFGRDHDHASALQSRRDRRSSSSVPHRLRVVRDPRRIARNNYLGRHREHPGVHHHDDEQWTHNTNGPTNSRFAAAVVRRIACAAIR